MRITKHLGIISCITSTTHLQRQWRKCLKAPAGRQIRGLIYANHEMVGYRHHRRLFRGRPSDLDPSVETHQLLGQIIGCLGKKSPALKFRWIQTIEIGFFLREHLKWAQEPRSRQHLLTSLCWSSSTRFLFCLTFEAPGLITPWPMAL